MLLAVFVVMSLLPASLLGICQCTQFLLYAHIIWTIIILRLFFKTNNVLC
jgi:hypothetical protein